MDTVHYGDNNATLPPELAAFSYLLGARRCGMRSLLLMVEAGKMRLVEDGETCVFETVGRVKFSVTRPTLSRDQEAALIDVLREILEEEGGCEGVRPSLTGHVRGADCIAHNALCDTRRKTDAIHKV